MLRRFSKSTPRSSRDSRSRRCPNLAATAVLGLRIYYSSRRRTLKLKSSVGDAMDRRLSAILAADVVGYSRLTGADEGGTLAALKRHRAEAFEPKVAQYHGRIV